MGLTVNRQMAKKIICQPSKTEYCYRQPSNKRAKISRQISLFNFFLLFLNNFFYIFLIFLNNFFKQFFNFFFKFVFNQFFFQI